MPARRKHAGKALSAAKGAAAKLVDLCLDMEDPLNEALDAAHALRLIGYALREVGNERDARAVASTAWCACQRQRLPARVAAREEGARPAPTPPRLSLLPYSSPPMLQWRRGRRWERRNGRALRGWRLAHQRSQRPCGSPRLRRSRLHPYPLRDGHGRPPSGLAPERRGMRNGNLDELAAEACAPFQDQGFGFERHSIDDEAPALTYSGPSEDGSAQVQRNGGAAEKTPAGVQAGASRRERREAARRQGRGAKPPKSVKRR